MIARVASHRSGPSAVVRRRSGFTLIELMIVIVIIVLLIALLVPAIGAAMQNAREGQVKQEIGQLEYAIADFKTKFGIDPPSYIDFRIDSATSQLPPRTQQLLRQMWPNINIVGFQADLVADPTRQRVLEGESCLVFFLGGMYDATTESFVGFSTNPRSPFVTTGKRIGPFFEFQKSRVLKDSAGIPIGYLDPLPGQKVPYYYVTSDRYGSFVTPPATTVPSPLPPSSLLPPRVAYFSDSAGKAGYNPQSFQIISAGPDGATEFDPDATGPLLKSSAPNSTPDQAGHLPGYWGLGGQFDPENDSLTTASSVDADNITNFHGGRLYP